MSSQWHNPAALAAIGILWPMLAGVAALLSPGPGVPSGYVATPDLGLAAAVLPATDLSGSTVVFADDNGASAGRIFWEVPEPGRVHITIELDPAQRIDDGADNGAADVTPAPE